MNTIIKLASNLLYTLINVSSLWPPYKAYNSDLWSHLTRRLISTRASPISNANPLANGLYKILCWLLDWFSIRDNVSMKWLRIRHHNRAICPSKQGLVCRITLLHIWWSRLHCQYLPCQIFEVLLPPLILWQASQILNNLIPDLAVLRLLRVFLLLWARQSNGLEKQIVLLAIFIFSSKFNFKWGFCNCKEFIKPNSWFLLYLPCSIIYEQK